MKSFLKRSIKSLKLVYLLYFYIGSFIIKLIGTFFSVDKNLVLFVVYGGKRYDDSPRFVYEYMKSKKEYDNYKLKWAFIDPQSIFEIPEKDKIKIDTWNYYKTALQAKYWLTNSSITRGLNFKKKETIYVFFTHGMTGVKKIGGDLKLSNQSFKSKKKEDFDFIILEGKKEKKICAKAWNISNHVLKVLGLPRNDELIKKTEDDILKLKTKLKIPLNRKVILYAPTFREYSKDSTFAIFLKPPFDFDLWNQELGDKYVMLLTAHYEVEKLMDVPKYHPFIINAFKYPHINDLMLVSDILISDYSSIIWDYSILGRPIISYAYDFEQYNKERGLYDGYETIFSHGIMKSQKEIIEFIKTMNYKEECEYTKKKIREEYIASYGNATEKCVKLIFK